MKRLATACVLGFSTFFAQNSFADWELKQETGKTVVYNAETKESLEVRRDPAGVWIGNAFFGTLAGKALSLFILHSSYPGIPDSILD